MDKNKLSKIILGLGNPGDDYVNTRHNIGFYYIDYLSRILKIKTSIKDNNVVYGEGLFNNNKVILAKPKTFVNNSGNAVKFLLNKYNLELENIIVIYDDMSLELGKIRIRPQGSSGGHNGIKSIINTVGSQNFSRIRVGIGAPVSNKGNIEYVLGKFP
tara:strand:- start:588 stop:1061 length:474 start_codon:yes stop_codon:yes gene_type:complete